MAFGGCHNALRRIGHYISIETQGSIWAPWVQSCDKICVSPKGPGMQENLSVEDFERFYSALHRHPGFYIKVVVFDQRDLEFIIELQERFPLEDRYFISVGNPNPPNVEGKSPLKKKDFVEWQLEALGDVTDKVLADTRLRGIKVLPQLHTFIWGQQKGK